MEPGTTRACFIFLILINIIIKYVIIERGLPGSGRFPAEVNGNPLQYSCLENPMGQGAWWAAVCGITKESDMTWQLNNKQQIIEGIFIRAWC